MNNALPACLDLHSYHDDAVVSALGSKVEAMSVDLKIIRLICALTDRDYADAHATIDHLSAGEVTGYACFQTCTARLALAALEQKRAAFDAAMIEWIAGREHYPGTWDDAVLDTPLIKPWVNIAIRPKPEAPRPSIKQKDLFYIKDLSRAVTRAVQDNIVWLREMGHKGPVADLADAYRLARVDRGLNEATLDGRDNLPDLIVSLDDQGQYRGSFLAH